jgi:hypothetical protein
MEGDLQSGELTGCGLAAASLLPVAGAVKIPLWIYAPYTFCFNAQPLLRGT